MKNEPANAKFKPVVWKGVGFNSEWQSKKTALNQVIDTGVRNSLKAFEDSKKSNQVIVGYRPD